MLLILKTLLTYVAYAITLGIFLAFTMPYSLLFWPKRKHKKVFSSFVYGYMKWAVQTALKFIGVLEVKEIIGLENVQKNAILISNHQSFLDGFIVMGHIPSVPLIKSSYRFNPLFSLVALLFDFVNVEYTVKGISNVDKRIRDLLKNGETVCVFPEGTRSLDGKIRKFQSLAFKIAKDSQAPLIPVVIYYDRPIMSKSAKSFLFGKKINVKIRILPAIVAQENDGTAKLLRTAQEAVEKSYLQLSRSPL